MVELVAVAALSENRVVGADGGLPWASLPADRAQYRALVADAPVVLGRRTFDSMRDDLPGTTQVGLSRSRRSSDVPGAQFVGDVETALSALADTGAPTAYVLGGGAIYHRFQPHVDRMVLSHVPGTYEGDATFPAWDESEWTVVREEPHDGFTLREWIRTEAAE